MFQVPYGVASTTVTYTLSVNGTGGTNFSETKYVRFMEKGFSIYIQTDKAVYKPGQKGNLAYYTPLLLILSVNLGPNYLLLFFLLGPSF